MAAIDPNLPGNSQQPPKIGMRKRSCSVSNLNLMSLSRSPTTEVLNSSRFRIEAGPNDCSPRGGYSTELKDPTYYSVIKIRERTKIRNTLRNFFECVQNLYPSKQLIISEFLSLNAKGEFILDSKTSITSKVADKILQMMRQLMENEIRGFFDFQGMYVSTPALLGWFKIAFTNAKVQKEQVVLFDRLCRHLLIQNKEFVKVIPSLELMKIPFPEVFKDASDGQKTIISFLQRLYPNKNKHSIHPNLFLATYTKFIPVGELFPLVKKMLVLKENEFPLIQKMRLLDLCRNWIASGLYVGHYSSGDILASIQEVITEALNRNHFLMAEQAYELSIMIHDLAIFNSVNDGQLQLFDKEMLTGISQKGPLVSKWVSDLSHDLHILSIHYFLELELIGSLGKEQKGMDQLAGHHKRIGKMVGALVNLGGESIFQFFVCVAYALYEMRDYQSTITIFSVLDVYSSKYELDKRWEELKMIANMEFRFKFLREKIEKHLKRGEVCVPFLEVYFGDIGKIKDVNSDMTEQGINFDKLELLSRSIWTLATFQKGLNSYWNELSKPVQLCTNIKQYQ